MKRRPFSLLLSLVLILALLPLGSARASLPASPPRQAAVQGEIAYVRDGNIWLLDLFTNESQQLTRDGDNRWPTWSTDGRYLLYTHGNMEETADLYILEVGQSEPRLLVENACCAAREAPDGERIAYIALAGEALAIEAIGPDGSGKETLFAPLQYGRSSWPTGNMFWLPEEQGGAILASLEVIENSAQAGLITYESVFIINLRDAKLEPIPLEKGLECSIRHPAVGTNTSAFAFEGSPGCIEGTTSAKGIAIGDRDLIEAPWLAYPSWSPDGQVLAAERYAEATDPAEAALQGIILYNPADGNEQMLVEGGSQPAWRPAPPVDAVAAGYAQPGERVVTVERTLTYAGSTYQVSFLTSGDYHGKLFHITTPTFFADQQITALVVTKDGQVVTDVETLRQIFLLYTAAYLLYEYPPTETVPAFLKELNQVIDNPVFMALEVEQLFRSRRDQTAEALRAILTDQQSAARKLHPLYDQALQQTPASVEEALNLVKAAVNNQAAHDTLLRLVNDDLDAAYADANKAVPWNQQRLKLMRLAFQLLYLHQLQAERADWLATYVAAFAAGDGSLDRDQIRATATVQEEVQSTGAQRVNIAKEFLKEEVADTLLDAAGEFSVQASANLLAELSKKYGAQVSARAVAAALYAVAVGTTLGSLLYGTDALFANFKLAERAEELRTTFRAGRLALQTQAASAKRAAPDALVYNGELAAQFRAAYLLETLAAVQTQHAYADGVAATFQLPNPLQLVNWLRGADWQADVANFHQRADEIEANLLNEIGAPAWLETAIALALSRMPKGPTVVVGTPVEPELPKLHPEWTSYTNGNFVNDLLVQGDTIWAATSGGVVRWNTRTGNYVKFTTEYGLTSNAVTSILQSTDGAFWFGTDGGGASRLDANGRWTTFTANDGLAGNSVMTIFQSTDHALWFSSCGEVSRLDLDGQWTAFTLPNGGYCVYAITQSSDKALWFGTTGGVSRLDDDGRWTTFTTQDGLVDNEVWTIFQSADGAIWFGTPNGVSRLDADGQWTTFTVANGLVDNYVYVIIQSADGALWFGTPNGVSRLDADGQWATFTTTDGLTADGVSSIIQSTDVALWFGTPNGISRLDANGTWTAFTTADSLTGHFVRTIVQSVDGAFWFGTDDGASRLAADGQWTTFTTKDGLADNNIASIVQSADYVLWLSTNNGVSRLSADGHWTTFTTKDGLTANSVWPIFQSTDGALWFGTLGSGASRLDIDGQWTTFTTNDGLASNAISSIAQSTDGALWFGTLGSGASRLDIDGQWTTFTTNDGLASNVIISIAQSADGAFWFGTDGGTSRLDIDGQWVTFTTKDGLANNGVWTIFQSTDGALWFGTAGGVSRLDANGNWTTFTTKDGLADNSVMAIAQSTDGSLWFGTGEDRCGKCGVGVSRLDAEAVRRLATGDSTSLHQPSEVSSVQPNSTLAIIGEDKIFIDDFWKRVYLTQYQLRKQLDNLQQLEKQFGDQGFFTKQIDQSQTTLSSPLALGTQVLNQMIEEKVIAQQTAKRGVTVSSEEIDEALREEIANSRGSVTKPQATATAQAALEATATAASWTPTPTPTVDISLKASATPVPTAESLPSPPILTDAEYLDGLNPLQENLRNTANISMDEYREIIRARLLSEKLSELIGQEKVPSTEEQIHVRHILLRDDNKEQALTRAKELRQRIQSGEDFSILAAKYSGDPGSASNGGELGWFGRGRMVLLFEAVAFSLEVGEISEPVETEFGFHLIEMLEKDKDHPKDQAQLEEEREQAYQAWLQEQIAATPIERPDDLASTMSTLNTNNDGSQPNLPSSGAVSAWEYQRIDGGSILGGDPAGAANLLNPLGQAGWDMAGVTATIFIMKRALTNPGAWEYQIVNGNPAAVENLLNPLGKEGWEVAGVTATFFILKRPLANPGAWEYQSVALAGDPISTVALLNPLGQASWDIAGTTGPFLILKRPLADPAAWEYQIVEGGGALLGDDPAGVANLLNPLGNEGWEMAGATATFFILRRPLANPERWEYQRVDGGSALGSDPAAMAVLLNPLGQAGWDVAGVTGPVLIMKRAHNQ